MIDYIEFGENVLRLGERIEKACARSARSVSEVKIIAVTKTHPAVAIEYAERSGLFAVGENRVQEAAAKRPQINASIPWELIGHLQSNKVAQALTIFDRIQSVDRIKLVKALRRHADKSGKTVSVLMQVNTCYDADKYGVSCEQAPALLEAILEADCLKIEGLMTIAPLDDRPAVVATAFNELRKLRNQLEQQFAITLPELSMGMSGDLELAIEAGSTCVRVGTALYGARAP